MSICNNCSFLYTAEGFRQCSKDAEPKNGDCIYHLEILPNNTALDSQVGGDHYKDLGIQPIEYIHANNLDFFRGNVIKYVTRNKNGKQDLEKAKHYIDLLIQLEYSNA